WQYPFGSLAASGAQLCFGSDWPVSSPNPMWQMHTAVNRTTSPGYPFRGPETGTPFLPGERIGLPAAIAAFTMGSAYLNPDARDPRGGGGGRGGAGNAPRPGGPRLTLLPPPPGRAGAGGGAPPRGGGRGGPPPPRRIPPGPPRGAGRAPRSLPPAVSR